VDQFLNLLLSHPLYLLQQYSLLHPVASNYKNNSRTSLLSDGNYSNSCYIPRIPHFIKHFI
jgi:hypothetical protein